MTDKKDCQLTAPTKNIMMSFQGDADGYKLYVVSARPLTLDSTHSLQVRIDKNPPISLHLRTIRSDMFAVDANDLFGSLETLIEQFDTGKTFIVRTTAISGPGIERDEGTLAGFAVKRQKFDACRVK